VGNDVIEDSVKCKAGRVLASQYDVLGYKEYFKTQRSSVSVLGCHKS